jgi:hypothetical protein
MKGKRSGLAAALFSLALLLCVPSHVLAQRGPDPLVGAWEVSIAGGNPGNIGHADGTLAETSVADVLDVPVSSPGYGVWAHTQANHYTSTMKFFLVGPGPAGYCTAKVRQNLTLTSADKWSGPARLDCLDGQGNVLFGSDLSVAATRMHLETLNQEQ